MSLERFRRPRMIVLRPRSLAYEAARAMAENGIGAIVVSEDQRVVGIVTDRDLALEVVAGDLDARTTLLRDVMTEDVATVDILASIEEAVQAMRARGCRRVPVTEHGRTVGLVSLDDLILERAIDIETAALIVRDQLRTAAATFKAEGTVHPEEPARPEMAPGRAARVVMRRRARAELAYSRLLRAVEAETGLTQKQDAERALLIVIGAVCRRVTPEEARHLIAQLPSKLQPDLQRVLDGPDRRITRASIEAELVRDMRVEPALAAKLVQAVGKAIADCISAGEIEAVRDQLPMELKNLFPPTQVSA